MLLLSFVVANVLHILLVLLVFVLPLCVAVKRDLILDSPQHLVILVRDALQVLASRAFVHTPRNIALRQPVIQRLASLHNLGHLFEKDAVFLFNPLEALCG